MFSILIITEKIKILYLSIYEKNGVWGKIVYEKWKIIHINVPLYKRFVE